MPKEPFEAKIVVKGKGETKTISVYDPITGRDCDTGLTAMGEKAVDEQVRKMKDTMERAGNRVTYREL